MRKKYCTLKGKAVYAGICLDCGRLGEAQSGKLEEKIWDCEHLFEKLVFVGATTSSRRRWLLGVEEKLALGKMVKYSYPEYEIRNYARQAS
jgi:hypothetical protein